MNKKKNILIVSVLSLILITTAILSGYHYLSEKRFNITTPMKDMEFKKQIIKDSKKLSFKLEALRPLVGEEELSEFIKENNDNPEVYTASEENIKKGIYRANLHMHTINSDGLMSVEELLDKAQKYGETLPDDKYMYVAITDHDTVNGAKDLIYVLEKNIGKYTKVKVVPGIEIYAEYHDSEVTNDSVQMHILLWCINPFDKFLNQEFYKQYLNDHWNHVKPHRDFDWTIATMRNYGIVGVAHPARYSAFLGKNKYAYITEMLNRYKSLIDGRKPAFTEGYYQTYDKSSAPQELGKEYKPYLEHINNTAKNIELIQTGSQDTHGKSIFSK